MGELKDVLAPALSSTNRAKSHLRGKAPKSRTPAIDAFACNEVCGFREIGAVIPRDRGRLFHGIAGSHFANAGRLIDSFMGSGLEARVKGLRGFSAHAFA